MLAERPSRHDLRYPLGAEEDVGVVVDGGLGFKLIFCLYIFLKRVKICVLFYLEGLVRRDLSLTLQEALRGNGSIKIKKLSWGKGPPPESGIKVLPLI